MTDSFLPTFGVTDFARRYQPGSGHSYFAGSWEALLALVQAQWPHRKPSPNNPHAVTVPVPAAELHRFFCASVTVTRHTGLKVRFAPRDAGEEPVLRITAQGDYTPAQAAEIVLYHRDALPDAVADYSVVAIKAYPTVTPEPIDPITMARNFLEKAGGTQADYTAQEFAEAIWYWATHASLESPGA